MRFKEGLKLGSKGGHGPIRYTVSKLIAGELVQFEFSKPKGYHGNHRFEITEITPAKTEIKHILEIRINGMALLSWPLAIRWLHDALIEDAFDKIENHFSGGHKRTNWSFWVRILRAVLK